MNWEKFYLSPPPPTFSGGKNTASPVPLNAPPPQSILRVQRGFVGVGTPLGGLSEAYRLDCMRQKCGSERKYLTRPTWYCHNPGRIKGALSDRVDQELDGILSSCCPTSEKQKQPRHKEDQEVEDSLRTSEKVAARLFYLLLLFHLIHDYSLLLRPSEIV